MERIEAIDWKEFNERKIKEESDEVYFSFKDWEIDFILEKIRTVYPEYNDVQILKAILNLCKESQKPHEKNEFIKKLINALQSGK